MRDSLRDERAFLKELRQARARAAHSIRTKPHAKSVRYDPSTRTVVIELMNGAGFSLPVDVIPGLQGASDQALADVWVGRADPGVHWETLDVDFEVFALVKTVLDTGTLLRAAKPVVSVSRAVTKETPSRQRVQPAAGHGTSSPRKKSSAK